MSRWSDRVEELLYDGESVIERIEVGTATVVVTSHRVLAFTPRVDGANFQQADRPNVTGVSMDTDSDSGFLGYALRATAYGLVLVVTGVFLPIDRFLSGVTIPETTGQLGIGGVLGLFQRLLSLLRDLDDIMQVFGALLLLFAIVPFGVYLWSREQSLVIELATDGESITLPVPESDSEAIAGQLEDTLGVDGRTDE